MLNIQSITLEGKHARLVPLHQEHAEGLLAAAQSKDIWLYMSMKIQTREDVQTFLTNAFLAQEKGIELPFTIMEAGTKRILGSTRFMNISSKDKGVEIGWTWLTPDVWKTSVNTECKYLLLRHCFEVLGCIRVQIKTDSRNVNSQRAIERIGGVREGVLRNHMIVQDGYVRDTVMYSILDREWEAVRHRLEQKL